MEFHLSQHYTEREQEKDYLGNVEFLYPLLALVTTTIHRVVKSSSPPPRMPRALHPDKCPLHTNMFTEVNFPSRDFLVFFTPKNIHKFTVSILLFKYKENVANLSPEKVESPECFCVSFWMLS